MLGRNLREGKLPHPELLAIAQLARRHFRQRRFVRRAATWEIVQEAGQLALAYSAPELGLRAYDALQLATALAEQRGVQEAGAAALTFVTADQRLLQIAQRSGVMGSDPATVI